MSKAASVSQRRVVLATRQQTAQALKAAETAVPEAVSPATPVPDRHGKPARIILDARFGVDQSTAVVVRREGDPATGDEATDETYDGLGVIHSFFLDVYERDSFDGRGGELRALVHYGKEYLNAFWDGQQFVLGDGDGRIFNRFSAFIDVLGHEFAVAMLNYETPLRNSNQAGSLLQSIADVFGSLVKQYQLKQRTEEADWLLGAGLIAGAEDQALRSMKAPGTAYDRPLLGRDRQPAHMDDYVQTTDDNGGIHINSGIPNHAFYLAATLIGGYAWEGAGRIWYHALSDRNLRATSGFRTFRSATVRAAERLYGPQSAEASAVEQAWSEVGIRPAGSQAVISGEPPRGG